MKNTICEKLMWAAMTPTMFKFIYKNCGEVDTSAVKKKARKNYKAMVERTPDIGSFMKNTLRVSLVGGIVWLSVYNAMDGKMSHEQFGEMVK
ncbi:MAG: L-2-amino-thiazoline-4-carboxylic acid hydrolase, partial [Ruminococcus sp.]|nr:L-2-amino-thiazoline-4-carboxylic acid hydrolase [Ruminococcus sp.]